MQQKRLSWNWVGAGLAGVLLLTGCGSPQKISYAAGNSITSNTNISGYNFLDWQAGMRVLMVYDGAYQKEDCESSMELKGTTAINQCRIVFNDGTIVVWRIVTDDGKSAELIINETSYRIPEAGNLVVIHPENGVIQVQQRQRELTTISFTEKSIDAWLKADPLIAPIVFPKIY